MQKKTNLKVQFYSQTENRHLKDLQEIYNVSLVFQVPSASLYFRFRFKLPTLEASRPNVPFKNIIMPILTNLLICTILMKW